MRMRRAPYRIRWPIVAATRQCVQPLTNDFAVPAYSLVGGKICRPAAADRSVARLVGCVFGGQNQMLDVYCPVRYTSSRAISVGRAIPKMLSLTYGR
jgi:hypothetical protein